MKQVFLIVFCGLNMMLTMLFASHDHYSSATMKNSSTCFYVSKICKDCQAVDSFNMTSEQVRHEITLLKKATLGFSFKFFDLTSLNLSKNLYVRLDVEQFSVWLPSYLRQQALLI
ncbi:hypothetical protein DIU31_031655 [Mucilaginibacter rubeus]|uniref:Transmembrane protein n=1 Tax=Mucilaginibacter rubeus TaxID=2027860 RepID=A0AAE6MM16_9SPHI|nr:MULTISPECIES: hypothetical protein [Mucilaginibacter]QEM07837.1 hypothetical protein DIU31_031655 [Mucilaginibacter rubeus]QEM20289.1 hypothetical protein DIU38_031260 [Mucilaginibacter gossypii]QTE42993.1 hypothetical protein J3L19_29405 [Mucilaginibacter rubeus]QTE49594.1 hypothetical protein J3L21_29365 [Mucilaginibacter rubeus]QTE65856.1 hypothetical protein J3L22_12840 [Mucilaginibacter rubeus]